MPQGRPLRGRHNAEVGIIVDARLPVRGQTGALHRQEPLVGPEAVALHRFPVLVHERVAARQVEALEQLLAHADRALRLLGLGGAHREASRGARGSVPHEDHYDSSRIRYAAIPVIPGVDVPIELRLAPDATEAQCEPMSPNWTARGSRLRMRYRFGLPDSSHKGAN